MTAVKRKKTVKRSTGLRSLGVKRFYATDAHEAERKREDWEDANPRFRLVYKQTDGFVPDAHFEYDMYLR